MAVDGQSPDVFMDVDMN